MEPPSPDILGFQIPRVSHSPNLSAEGSPFSLALQALDITQSLAPHTNSAVLCLYVVDHYSLGLQFESPKVIEWQL